jgi:FkbM family methyltransferase
MMRAGPWKPWYVWRPRQLGVRLWRACRPTRAEYRPISVSWGESIVANPVTTIGRSLWTTAVHDIAMSETMARLVRPGAVVIDAGAHVGYTTLLAAVAAGGSGSVFAFEPHPELFAVLERNVAAARASRALARVSLRNAAMGDKSGSATLLVPAGFEKNDGIATIGTAIGGGEAFAVEMTTVDSVLSTQDIEHVTLLKVDVEGHDLQVLRGGEESLKRHRIRHVIYEDFNGVRSETTRMLDSYGYRIFSIGWSIRGPLIAPAADGCLTKEYEAPSYLATLDADAAVRSCAEPGWRVLRKDLGRNGRCA